MSTSHKILSHATFLAADKFATKNPHSEFYFVIADETIETSVKRFDNDHMQLLCRVKNLKNILKFCRFERLDDDDFGLNLEDGIASSNYRYFGQGLVYGDCGLEIKPLRDLDRMQWRCFVGLMDADDVMKNIPEASKRIYKHSALLDASDAWNKLQGLMRKLQFYPTSALILILPQSLTLPARSSSSFTMRPPSSNVELTIRSTTAGFNIRVAGFSRSLIESH